MSEHSLLSPSAAARWINCPGSVALGQNIEDELVSESAQQGSYAHSVAEHKLRYALECLPLKTKKIMDPERRKKYEETMPFNEKWDCPELHDHVDGYVNNCLTRFKNMREDNYWGVEEKVNIDCIGGFGTIDFYILAPGGLSESIKIIDLKYGTSKVQPSSPQLRLYAWGLYNTYKDIGRFKSVELTVYQPRIEHFSGRKFPITNNGIYSDALSLEDWVEKEIVPAVSRIQLGNETLKCGQWCWFCKAKTICPEIKKKVFDKAIDIFRDSEV